MTWSQAEERFPSFFAQEERFEANQRQDMLLARQVESSEGSNIFIISNQPKHHFWSPENLVDDKLHPHAVCGFSVVLHGKAIMTGCRMKPSTPEGPMIDRATMTIEDFVVSRMS